MIEFLKELIKEPENFKKYVIIILKFVLIAILTSKVYIYFFGVYEPILIGDVNFWHDTYSFIISGKILLVTFLFFVLKYAVFDFFSILTYLLTYFITSKIKKSKLPFRDPSFFKGILLIFNVIKYNREKDIIETGKNFETAYSALINNDKEDVIEQFDNIKNSFLYEIFILYNAFILIYFFILEPNSGFFNGLIITGFIVLLYLIFSLQYVYELVCANYDDLFFGIKILKQKEITKKLLSENGITIKDEVNNSFSNFLIFQINNIEFGIEHFLGKKLSSEHIKETNLPNDSKLILITSKKLPVLLENKLKENSKLIIIEFNCDEVGFIQKLEDALFNNSNSILKE